jgi:sulfur carrier protein
MIIDVNGNPTDLGEATSVAELVATISTAHRGVAVAVSGEIVPRGEWAGRLLQSGDHVEILTAVQGG